MFWRLFVRPGIGAVPQPEQRIQPEAGGMACMKKIEMSDPRKSEIVWRQQHLLQSGIAIVGKPAANGTAPAKDATKSDAAADKAGAKNAKATDAKAAPRTAGSLGRFMTARWLA